MSSPLRRLLPTFMAETDALPLCAETSPDDFFPEPGGSAQEAKDICSRCELRNPCAQWALDTSEPHGVWGGLSQYERRQIKQGLPLPTRQRPWTDSATRTRVLEFLARGWSPADIAREVGCSDRTVHRIRAQREAAA